MEVIAVSAGHAAADEETNTMNIHEMIEWLSHTIERNRVCRGGNIIDWWVDEQGGWVR